MPKIRTIPAPPAVFLPATAEEAPDLTVWAPNDKQRVLEFVAPGAYPALRPIASLTGPPMRQNMPHHFEGSTQCIRSAS